MLLEVYLELSGSADISRTVVTIVLGTFMCEAAPFVLFSCHRHDACRRFLTYDSLQTLRVESTLRTVERFTSITSFQFCGDPSLWGGVASVASVCLLLSSVYCLLCVRLFLWLLCTACLQDASRMTTAVYSACCIPMLLHSYAFARKTVVRTSKYPWVKKNSDSQLSAVVSSEG